MRFLSLTLFLASLATGIVASDSNYLSYDGYKVFRVKTQRQLATIQKKLSNLRLELWETGTQGVDVVVPPEKLSKFKELGLEYSTMHEDLGASITAEAPKTFDKRQVSNSSWFDSYHNYTDHIQFFNDLQAGFPNNSEIVSAGKSVEGRDLFGIHFWGAGGPGKPVVLYHATVHAREWIAAPVVEYLSTQLIEGYKAGENVSTGFLNKYDFYVFPFVNPDGMTHPFQ